MDERSWVPAGVDPEKANIARVYDYLLDGGHNFAIDRQLAERGLELLPNLRDAARFNRAFLRRAVMYCVDAGIRQFLDLGSGVPTAGNVHEVVQEITTDGRVVYVDNEPIAVTHGKALLNGNQQAEAIFGDVRDPRSILDDPVTRRLIDFDEPVAVLMVAVLHSVADDADPAGIVARFREAMVPGSVLVLSHGTPDQGSDRLRHYIDLYRNSDSPVHQRTHRQVRALFDGFDLLEPGLVFTPEWRPDRPEDVPADPERGFCYAGVGVRR